MEIEALKDRTFYLKHIFNKRFDNCNATMIRTGFREQFINNLPNVFSDTTFMLCNLAQRKIHSLIDHWQKFFIFETYVIYYCELRSQQNDDRRRNLGVYNRPRRGTSVSPWVNLSPEYNPYLWLITILSNQRQFFFKLIIFRKSTSVSPWVNLSPEDNPYLWLITILSNQRHKLIKLIIFRQSGMKWPPPPPAPSKRTG